MGPSCASHKSSASPPVLRRDHSVSLLAKDVRDDRANLLLVFDEQDRLRPTKSGRGNLGADAVDLRRDPREVDLERGSFSRLAVDPEVSSALLHDAEHGRETEARALAGFLGRVEGLENPCLRRLVHSATRVGDGEHHVVTRLRRQVVARVRLVQSDVRSLDCQHASRGHRIPGVDYEVQDDLLDVTRVRLDPSDRLLGEGDQLHVLSDEPLEHLLHAREKLVQVEHPGLDNLLPAEHQELSGETSRSQRCLSNFVYVRSQRVGGLEIVENQLSVAEDDGEHVVEVVRDPAGETPDRFHLLRLSELFLAPAKSLLGACSTCFRFFALRQIRHEGDAPRVVQHGDPDEAREAASVFAERVGLQGRDDPRGPQLLHHVHRQVAELGRRQVRPSHETLTNLLARVADHGEVGVVGFEDVPVQVGDDDPDDARFGERSEARLALSQRILAFAVSQALAAFTQLALHRGRQSTEPILEDVIVGAAPHGVRGRVLPDRSGYDDEWQVEPGFP